MHQFHELLKLLTVTDIAERDHPNYVFSSKILFYVLLIYYTLNCSLVKFKFDSKQYSVDGILLGM